MGRRLFERFEHRIEGMARQHVDFVDHIDLEASRARRVDSLLKQLGHFIDASVGGGIELQIVDKTALIDFGTSLTNAARRCRDTGFTVERFGQNTRECCFTDTSGASKQPSVVKSLSSQCVREGANNVVLTDQRIERARAPFTRENQIAHKFYRPQT